MSFLQEAADKIKKKRCTKIFGPSYFVVRALICYILPKFINIQNSWIYVVSTWHDLDKKHYSALKFNLKFKSLFSQKDCHKWFGTDINSQKIHNLVRPGCEQPPFDLLNVHQQRARWLPACPTCFGHLKSH